MISKLVPSQLSFLLCMSIEIVLSRENVVKLLGHYSLGLTQNFQICLTFHLFGC